MEKMSKDLKKIKNKLDNAFSKLFNYDIVDEVLVELNLWDLYSKWVEKEDDEDFPLTLEESESLLKGFKECYKVQKEEDGDDF